MRSSIATVCIAGSLTEKLSAIARAGFDGYELFENDLVTSTLSPEQVAARSVDLGLSIDLYQPFRDFEGVSEEQLTRNLERARRKFELMHRLGVDTMLLCSNVGTATTGDPVILVDQLGRLAELAGEHDIRVAHEALAWGKYVSTYDASWRLVAAVDHPALGVCLDSFHILSRGTSLDAIADIPGEKIFFCQLADAPRMQLDVLSWSRHYRVFPGEGDWDLADFVARLLDAGYSGPLSLEVFNDVFRQADPAVTARDARRSLLLLEAQVRALPGGYERDLAELPPPQSPRDFSFVEVAPGADESLDEMLRSLGFQRRGRHRRKNAVLWTQGDAHVVVNEDRAAPAARLLAVGLEVADVGLAAERTSALQARIVPRDRVGDEAVLEATAAPDGTEFYFSGRRADGSTWEEEFGAATANERDAGVTRIDHVAVIQPWDRFDEAALFFRAVLGLTIEGGLGGMDLPSETGLVRSRSLVSADRRIRIATNVAPVGSAREGQFVNHVAFATDDLVASLERMRSHGIRMLRIPDNYYDDLEARFGIEPETLARYREFDVLYDRDPGGTFLHAYTAPMGDLVFELVERVDNYEGYGAANAHVRLSAVRAQR